MTSQGYVGYCKHVEGQYLPSIVKLVISLFYLLTYLRTDPQRSTDDTRVSVRWMQLFRSVKDNRYTLEFDKRPYRTSAIPRLFEHLQQVLSAFVLDSVIKPVRVPVTRDVLRYVSDKFYVSMALWFRRNLRHVRDRRTDGWDAILYRPDTISVLRFRRNELAAGASRCATTAVCNLCHFSDVWMLPVQIWKIPCSPKNRSNNLKTGRSWVSCCDTVSCVICSDCVAVSNLSETELTRICTARWPRRHAALPDSYRSSLIFILT